MAAAGTGAVHPGTVAPTDPRIVDRPPSPNGSTRMPPAPNEATPTRTAALVVAAALPPLALALIGAFHPHDLTMATARRWTDVHLVALPVFGLLGLAPWLLLRRIDRRLGLVAAVLAWVYAAFYTALDVLAGIGAGTAQQRAAGAGVGDLFDRGNSLAAFGVAAYLLATVLAAAATLRATGPRRAAWIGAGLVAVAAVSFLSSHIYWWRGGLTMLALALGWTLLALCPVRPRERPPAVHP